MKRFLMTLTAIAAICTTQVEAKLTNYKVLLTVGQDEFLDQNPISTGATAYQDFQDILDWSSADVEELRAQAIAYYADRFGIDFSTGFYDTTSRFTFLPGNPAVTPPTAILLPISFKSKYRVLDSNVKQIPEGTSITALEYVVSFQPLIAGTNYGGTYAASSAVGPIPINPTDTFDYGVYHLIARPKHHKKKKYNIFVRNWYPNRVEPVTDLPPRVVETVQLVTKDFGDKDGYPGAGFLHVGTPTAANGAGKWPTFTRGTWSFGPGSLVESNLNGFTEVPVDP